MANLKEVSCKKCGASILRSNGRINENLKFGHNFFCSRKCQALFKTKQQKLICENCGRSFSRAPHEIYQYNYCTQSCAASANNRKYPKKHPSLKSQACECCGVFFRKSTGNAKYCSMKCMREDNFYTPDELLEIIKKKARESRRTPSRREMRGISSACQRFYGSWNKAIIAAGLAPNRSDSQRMYKRTHTKALDGHLCDSISEALIDNWLFVHKISHQRDAIYPSTNHKADWSVDINGQRTFIEYFGLARDSARYDGDINKKKELCRINKIPLVEIYPQDLYPKKYLLDKLRFLLSGRPDLHRS